MKQTKIIFLLITCFLFFSFFHPFYQSVCDLKYNAKEKILEGTLSIFTNDLEDALTKLSKSKVDLYNRKDSLKNNEKLKDYLLRHLKINVNKEDRTLHYLGSDREMEQIWIYFEIKDCELPKQLQIENKILYEFLKEEINIVHSEINGIKKSYKVVNPESKILIEF